MNRTFVKFASRKFIPAFIVTAALLASAPVNSMANTTNDIEIVSNENTATVKYTGSADDALFLEVKVNNPKADKFTLTIRTDDGTVLYSKDYTDISFIKKVKILKADDITRYNIGIRSSNKSLENNFSISTVSKTIDDVVVTRL
jgi:hypothetical protein